VLMYIRISPSDLAIDALRDLTDLTNGLQPATHIEVYPLNKVTAVVDGFMDVCMCVCGVK